MRSLQSTSARRSVRTGVSLSRRAVAMLMVLLTCHLVLVPVAWSHAVDEDRSEHTAKQYGLGVASFFATIPYGALKFVFATLGGVFGGMTWVFSGGNRRAADAVWHTSVRGTYVISPEHLKGARAVRFFGIPPSAE